LPVFSNVGEPDYVPPLVERPRRLVVFGGRGPRSRVYQRSRLALERTCRDLEIEEIVDIGPSWVLRLSQSMEPLLPVWESRLREISSLLSSSVVVFLITLLSFWQNQLSSLLTALIG
jgi:hypothetical protein